MNVVALIGRLTHDPQIRYTGDNAVLGFRIAVDRQRKDSGADFINCTAFGKTAETIATWMKKGSPIAIQGHIQTGSYKNKEGNNVQTFEVVVDRFEFVGGGRSEGGNNQPQNQYAQPQGYSQPQYTPPRQEELPPGFTEIGEGLPF